MQKKGQTQALSYSPNKDIPENSTNQGLCEKKSAAPAAHLWIVFLGWIAAGTFKFAQKQKIAEGKNHLNQTFMTL